MTLIERTRAGFVRTYGHEPDGVVFAPGRVNLIGEHVDYNAGLVLPMPIAAGTAIAWSAAPTAEIAAVALDLDRQDDRFALGAVTPHQPVDWRSYLRGMTAELAAKGVVLGGAKLAIAGSIPRGSGLSSSASLCVALGRALVAACGAALPAARDLALAAQAAEHHWAGVHCGIMDQMAIAAGEAGAALLLDCRDLAT
ncbi:MAG: galactokinase, partial [Pseudomonadota bacterium]